MADVEFAHILDGGDGGDYVYGEEGDDTLYGGLGDDELDGGGQYGDVILDDPEIIEFMGVQLNVNTWRFTGRIVDHANPGGMTVSFGGVIPVGTSVEVEEDGTFELLVVFPEETVGYATAEAEEELTRQQS